MSQFRQYLAGSSTQNFVYVQQPQQQQHYQIPAHVTQFLPELNADPIQRHYLLQQRQQLGSQLSQGTAHMGGVGGQQQHQQPPVVAPPPQLRNNIFYPKRILRFSNHNK